MRKIECETGNFGESVRRIAKQELQLEPYKIQKVQLLMADNKRERLKSCRRLLGRITPMNWERILFLSEKLFTIEQAHNDRNDRSWCAEAPGTSAVVEHRQNPKSMMVYAGICATGKTPLVFIDEGVKIDQNVYRRDILDAVMVAWARRPFGRQQWTL